MLLPPWYGQIGFSNDNCGSVMKLIRLTSRDKDGKIRVMGNNMMPPKSHYISRDPRSLLNIMQHRGDPKERLRGPQTERLRNKDVRVKLANSCGRRSA